MAFAFIFSDVGVGEWFVLLAVVLVVVGPKRLPEAARTLGRWYSRMCRMAESFRRQLMEMDSGLEGATTDFERQIEGAFTVEEDSSGAQDMKPEDSGAAAAQS